MYRKIFHHIIVWLILISTGDPQTTLADSQAVSTSPPDLEFIYHDEWWSANSFSTEAAKYRTVAGDFNGDGQGDIAMLHRRSSTIVRFYVMLGAGDHFDWQGIWLEISDTLNADMVTGRVVAGDFNNDGYDDIAAFADASETILYVFLSDGSSGFSYHDWWYGDGDYDDRITGRVVTGDFDGDGWVDDIAALYDATGDPSGITIRADVFLSDGSGFSDPADWWSRDRFSSANAQYRTVAGDVDADGDDDVVMIFQAVDFDGDGDDDTNVYVLRASKGAFSPEIWWQSDSYIAGRTTGRVVAGDFDGDGDNDVALLYDYFEPGPPEKYITRGHVLLSTRQWFSYQGSIPGWWEHEDYVASYATGLVVAGDWDGNGVDDMSMIYPGSDPQARAQVLEATAPSPQPPATRQVDGGDPGCGDASGAPFCTIQSAVDAASDGDTIQVASGGYFENVSAPKYSDPGFNQTLTIQGAGAASTFVDGNDSGPVFAIHPGADITLKGLTIRNGNSGYGGGIYINSGINNNGAGVVTISDSALMQNFAKSDGGGIYNEHGTLTISDSTVSENSADAGIGGGIANDAGVVLVSRSIISGNSAANSGGISSVGGSLAISDSVLTDNTTAGDGGGINNIYGTLTIDGSILQGNSAEDAGGILNQTGGIVTMTNSTLSGNTALKTGGGMLNTSSSDTAGSSMTVTNSTLNRNTAGTVGGGILNINSTSTVSLVNSIIANSIGADCVGSGTWNSTGSPNLDSDGSCPGFPLTGDPLLGPLQDNGGPNQTHALLKGSPAIDAGNNAACPATDQRGVFRPMDGDGDGSAICDLGAFESSMPGIYLPLVIKNP